MTPCPQCGRSAAHCRCARQASLLAAPPLWRSELQQRVDAYRARRGQPAPPPPPSSRVLSWPLPAESASAPSCPPAPSPAPFSAQMLRPLASALADPVVAPAPPAEPAPAAIAPAPVAASAPPRSDPWDRDGLLQLPLPMVAPADSAAAADLPQVAAAALRAHAALLDALVVLAGAGLFAAAAWAVHGFATPDPHWLRAMLPAWVGVPALLAALYLWLCGWAGGVTLGMRSLGLQLASLDAEPLTDSALRRRAWASLVSLAALGLGFAWMYCDGQGLTWHDAISRTCVVQAKGEPA